MKTIAKLGIATLLMMSLVAGAYAFGGLGSQNEAAKQAIENGDFASWKNAMSAELTEERFNMMREQHQQMEQRNAEMDAAIEQGYDAWKDLVADSPRGNQMADMITEENFDTFVKMHETRQNGDFEAARTYAQELGIEQKSGSGRRFGGCKGGFMRGNLQE